MKHTVLFKVNGCDKRRTFDNFDEAFSFCDELDKLIMKGECGEYWIAPLPEFVFDWADDAKAWIIDEKIPDEDDRYLIDAPFDAPQHITALELVTYALMVTEAWNAEGTENEMDLPKVREEAREWIEAYFEELEAR